MADGNDMDTQRWEKNGKLSSISLISVIQISKLALNNGLEMFSYTF